MSFYRCQEGPAAPTPGCGFPFGCGLHCLQSLGVRLTAMMMLGMLPLLAMTCATSRGGGASALRPCGRLRKSSCSPLPKLSQPHLQPANGFLIADNLMQFHWSVLLHPAQKQAGMSRRRGQAARATGPDGSCRTKASQTQLICWQPWGPPLPPGPSHASPRLPPSPSPPAHWLSGSLALWPPAALRIAWAAALPLPLRNGQKI